MNDADENGALPRGWTHTTMGKVAAVVGGGTPKTKITGNFDDDTGHPWLTPADLRGYQDKYVARGRRNLTDQGLAGSSAKYMPAGTVLFSSRAPIGYVAIAENAITTNQGFRSFVPSGALDSNYAYHYLRSITDLAERLASGTTFNELSGSKAKTLPLPLPPIAEQRRIAERLDQVEPRRSAIGVHLDAARRAIDQFRSAILASACSGRLTADWREVNPAENVNGLVERVSRDRAVALGRRAKSPAPISEAELPEIPPTWAWVSVDSLSLAVVDGVHKTPTYVDAGIPFITVRNLTAGRGISFDVTKFITPADHEMFTQRTKPERGDILISKDGTIGVTRAVRTDREFSIFVSVALVKPVTLELTDYLELALQSPHVQAQMVGVGSGLVHLVLRDLKADGVPLPPLAEQREIVARVNTALTVADRLSARIERTSATLDRAWRASLAKAFRGELVATEAALADEEGREFESADEMLARTIQQPEVPRARGRGKARSPTEAA